MATMPLRPIIRPRTQPTEGRWFLLLALFVAYAMIRMLM